ncbi:hypothetical protein PCIT_a4371 [Pseudoalteromonas citrea]|uniref:EamA domain-containing protein n=2 Tax=Pseudoalteromonas citrea TaxID=43655 RepID=A0AAD4FQN5_9GAMM|nr:EamA family transporter [Pseudoalteromonas citrea]KAF7767479.1 hypothetical protein PCIT_a4371 [Pseudoalteromonas citrea]
MKSMLLYIMTVLIWGSTWLAIEFQLGTVNEIVSLCLRFSLAALCMWGYVLFKRMPMYFDLKTHGFFILLAMGNFGLNYLMLYYAQGYLNSAMASIAFSLLLIFNIINTRLFFGKPIAKRIYSGALFGVAGIVALFWHDLSQFDLSNGAIAGLGLALLGTLIASFGNMVSVRNSNKGIGVLQGNAWGMLYSSVLLAVFALLNGETFVINASWQYWSSLIYLAVFGTVIAFASYFSLLKNIGPERASYIIVLFPLVAVLLSTYFEGFTWQANTFVGFSLVLLGNAIVLTPFDKLKAHLAASPVRT